MTEWRAACRLAELALDEPFGATIDGVQVCIVRRAARCYAFEDMCTHELVRLSKGFLEGDVIECPLHEAKFDITTGRALCAPAERDVATYEVRVEGDQVLVKL